MENTLESTLKKTLTKLGVRLIGLFFLIQSVYYFFQMIPDIRQANDFWGLYLVYVIVFAYVGVQLLRFHPSGRYWALFILWAITLLSSGILIWVIALLAKDWTSITIDVSKFKWLSGMSVPAVVLLLIVGVFLYVFIPTYYLMRKDVKQLFEKTIITGETH